MGHGRQAHMVCHITIFILFFTLGPVHLQRPTRRTNATPVFFSHPSWSAFPNPDWARMQLCLFLFESLEANGSSAKIENRRETMRWHAMCTWRLRPTWQIVLKKLKGEKTNKTFTKWGNPDEKQINRAIYVKCVKVEGKLEFTQNWFIGWRKEYLCTQHTQKVVLQSEKLHQLV